MKKILLCAITSLAFATAVARAEATLVPAPRGSRLVLDAEAQGVQVYTCQKVNDGYRWVFSAPDAALFDAAGRQIGTHFAGPSWQLEDGSKVIGEVAAQAASPQPLAVAWLLLRAKSHEGHGILSGVASVRRIDTLGGVAPAQGCDAARTSQQARMRYSARYLFYAPR